MSLVTELKPLLDSDTERPVVSWLKKHPLVLTRCFQWRQELVAEFPFGSDFRADFVSLAPYSGGFDVRFIEFEPPNTPLFTKSGNVAKRLAGAIAQVDSWRSFIELNRHDVLRELSKFFKKRELVFSGKMEPIDHCGRSLHQAWLDWSYCIVIGRRSQQSEEQIQKKASFYAHHNIELITYDRLLDKARELDLREEM